MTSVASGADASPPPKIHIVFEKELAFKKDRVLWLNTCQQIEPMLDHAPHGGSNMLVL